jgi:hypothetical protein
LGEARAARRAAERCRNTTTNPAVKIAIVMNGKAP